MLGSGSPRANSASRDLMRQTQRRNPSMRRSVSVLSERGTVRKLISDS